MPRVAGFVDFGGKFFDASDDAALFGEWREGDFYSEKSVRLKANTVCCPFACALTRFDKFPRSKVEIEESRVGFR